MQNTLAVNYPVTFDRKFCLGKLPPVRKEFERKMCVGRVWIFLLLGVFLVVLGLVSFGVYLNVDGLTSSSKFTEILPLYINSGVIVFAGLVVCSLFWKRLKALVFVCVVVCVASGFLCGITSVLTSTHVIVPIQHLTSCRYYTSQNLCQCLSPYRRQMLSLEYSETEVTKYDFEDVSGCESIQEELPQLLFILVGTYAVVFLTCIVSAILSLLVLRAERLKRGFFRDEVYEEVYTVSGHSSQDQSDCESEVNAEVILPPPGQLVQSKNRAPRASNSDTINSTRSNLPISRSATSTSNSVSSLQNKPAPRLSKTPVPNDLAKETLANRYRINKTPDRDTTYRHRISKTPDREVGASRRRNSFVLAKRLSKSCDSLESSGTSQENLPGLAVDANEKKKKGRLKEHRRKGKRAATVATLDTDQLLLILNLQMRYLQETKEQNSTAGLNSYPRRAITPQPTSAQKIPQKVRSHTPQPQRANNRKRSSAEQEFYAQIESLQSRCRDNTNCNLPNLPASVSNNSGTYALRNASDSSVRCFNSGQEAGSHQQPPLRSSSVDRSTDQDRCLHREPPVAPRVTEPYNPYLHTTPAQVNSVDSVHYLTYSDNMPRRQEMSLRTRASVQNQTLPPQPLHRGGKHQLPSQPISRQGKIVVPLPPQPMHRGQSAFHVVDRGSKSRSPSVASDIIETTPKWKPLKPDFADAAIRENFKLKASPFLFQDSFTPPPSNSCHGRTEADGRHQKEDSLPPYSGPPSYKEYVSSCDNSVNSSLSSNPDDVYSLPQRRVGREQNSANQNNCNRVTANQNVSSKNSRNLTNQIPPYRPSANQYDPNVYSSNQNEPSNNIQEPERATRNHNQFDSEQNKRDRNFNVFSGNNVYGNNGCMQTHQNSLCGDYENPYGRNITQSDEALYSFPVKRSQVKQCIVPEDYYTPINKIGQSNNIYANEPSVRGDNFDMAQQVSLAGYDGEYSNCRTTSASAPRSGFIHTFNPSAEHQIAPDAKYNEYEDVYESSASVAKQLPRYPQGDSSTVPYSVNSHGFRSVESPKLNSSSKTKGRTLGKPGGPHQVSNVSACSPKLPVKGTDLHQQVLSSVQNVHAKNVQNIPRIKLNDSADVSGELTDDDVFVDSNVYRYPNHIQVPNTGSQTARVIDFSGPVPQQTNIREPTFYVTNEMQGPGHVMTDLTNQETDSGYMRMTLPEKNRLGGNTDNIHGHPDVLKTGDLLPDEQGMRFLAEAGSVLPDEQGVRYLAGNGDVLPDEQSVRYLAGNGDVLPDEQSVRYLAGNGDVLPDEQSVRYLPDGVEQEKPETKVENYEETGV